MTNSAKHDDPGDQLDAGLRAGFAIFGRDAKSEVDSLLERHGWTADGTSLRPDRQLHGSKTARTRQSEAESGAHIARYDVLGELGRGGVGRVLLTRDPDLQRDLAMKVLLDEHATKPEMVRRFVEEAKILGQLEHPGVLPVHELGVSDDQRPYFTMRLIRGETMAALLADRDSSDGLPRLLSVFEHVCQAVAYSHTRGVAHLDLKPANVMVGSFGEVQVLDWGLARILPASGSTSSEYSPGSTGDATRSRPGNVAGTPAYMAPEQARGHGDRVDERADVFALGAILCEILTGTPPYTGKTSADVRRQAAVADQADTAQRLHDSGADPELSKLALRCLEPDLTSRLRDAGEISEAIRQFFETSELRARQAELTTAEALGKAAEERRSRRLTMWLTASMLVIALLGVAFYARDKAEREEELAAALIDLGSIDRLLEQSKTRGGDGSLLNDAWDRIHKVQSVIGVAEASERTPAGHCARLISELEAERRALATAESERLLITRLTSIRTGVVEPSTKGAVIDWKSRDQSYTEVFAKHGFHLGTMSDEELAQKLRSCQLPSRIATGLGFWALAKLRSGQRNDGLRLLAITSRADSNRRMAALRDGLQARDTAPLRDLIRADAWTERSPAAILLVADALSYLGSQGDSLELLRRAWPTHPESFELNMALGRASSGGSRDELKDATRYFGVAYALRPDSRGARLGLRDALRRTGGDNEASRIARRPAERWRRLTPDTIPPSNENHAFAYDSRREVTILFGGVGPWPARPRLGQTWQWDGIRWTLLQPEHRPSPRASAEMVYDSRRDRIVLFGGIGYSASERSDETWEWDGADWLRCSPSTVPPNRTSHVMAYDSHRDRVVMFGGNSGFPTRTLADTWEWDGTDWKELHPATRPSPRSESAAVYDPSIRRVVIYGGRSFFGKFSTPLDDTWEWDGREWVHCSGQPPENPPRRMENGRWIYPTPGQRVPPRRVGHEMAYHPGEDAIVLFGGREGHTGWPRTWMRVGRRWIEHDFDGPPATTGMAMAYDVARQCIVLFGGMRVDPTPMWQFR